jgi:cardiolipin synthase
MSEVINALSVFWIWSMQHLMLINILLSIMIIFFQRRDPQSTWTWLLALYAIPLFGILIYLLLGQDYRKSKMFRVKQADDQMKYPVLTQERLLQEYGKAEDEALTRDYGDLIMYNLRAGSSVLTIDNTVEIFTDGSRKFADLTAEIRRAKRFIHIQYYIIKNDFLFRGIAEELKKKAAEGVEVRVLCDGMGGRFMPAGYWNKLRKCGIKVGIFFPPTLGRINLRINYRNHRKIVVIDGEIGYVGGFNIGKEYVDQSRYFGHWRDTHLKIRGGAVASLEQRFALDWNYATHENLFKNKKYQNIPSVFPGRPEEAERRPIGIQIVTSGPDSSLERIRDNYIELFNKAKDHIYITTPYFIPDNATLSALIIAAKSGVDVRLMIPCKPDHPFVYWATTSWAGTLLQAGGKVFTYQDGFLHSKTVMVDGNAACVGTANMDIRSFKLNFEVNATIFDPFITGKLERQFTGDIERHCREILPEEYEERNLFMRFREQLSRLFSPLL